MIARLRRHPIWTALGIGLLIVVALLGWYLATFDLNRYRGELDSALETALGRPVLLGSAQFSLRHGLAVEVRDIVVGEPGDRYRVEAKRLFLALRLTPLLRGHLTFSGIILDRPRLTIDTTVVVPAGDTTTPPLHELVTRLRGALIETLTIRNASVQVGRGSDAWEVGDTNLLMRHLSVDGPIEIDASGSVSAGSSTPWALRGRVAIAPPAATWRDIDLDLQLDIAALHQSTLIRILPFAAAVPGGFEGAPRFALTLKGTPNSGLAFAGALTGEALSISVPSLYSRPLPFRELRAAGMWRTADGRHRFTDLTLHLDQVTMSGNFVLPERQGETITVALALPATPLVELTRLVPDRLATLPGSNLLASIKTGTIAVPQVSLRWPVAAGDLPLQAARVNLAGAEVELPGLGRISDCSASLDWQGEQLQLADVRARLLDAPFTGRGTVSVTAGKTRLDFTAAVAPSAAALRERLPADWRERLVVAGSVPLTLSVAGSLDYPLVDLHADLTPLGIAFDRLPIKETAASGDLLLAGRWDNDRLELDHGRLALPCGEVRTHGFFAFDGSQNYHFTLDGSRIALEKLPLPAAFPTTLTPRGEGVLHLDLAGSGGTATTSAGWLELRNAALHTGATADLSQLRGRLELRNGGLTIEKFSARLGSSPVRGSGRLTLSPTFNLTLNIAADTIRADELTFSNDRLILSDVAGRLVIDSEGLRFEQIAVHLGDDSALLIDGTLRNFKHPEVVLDIEASKADIAAIIALWDNPATPRGASPPAPPTDLSVRVTTRVASGLLYGLHFTDGSATVAYRNRTLVVHPLRLKVGKGLVVAQVVTEPSPAGGPLLRLSGHGNGIDADAVYNQMLGRKGLLTGTLSGDFYLQGEPGEHFKETLYGGINVGINKGVLRGFTSLARIFSLLNVSQIFTLRLPDMARDGMPFDELRGTFAIDRGIIKTDDLAVDSEAMNLALVGEHHLAGDRLNFILGVKPLRTVDKIVSSIPLAGWILTGEQKALITAQFRVTGTSDNPQVEAIPITSVGEMVIGIFRRIFSLPGKIAGDVKSLFEEK